MMSASEHRDDMASVAQYRDPSNLSARIQLHQRFSTNRTGWFHWLFDQLSLPVGAHILELGCGRGDLWAENRARLPAGLRITLTDRSPGMVQAARSRLVGVTACVADAQALPFAADTFDVVLANHMLYHVSDRPRAFREIRRVLRAEGSLYAATNGEGHLRELDALLARCAPGLETQNARLGFSLDNGFEQLRPWFRQVSCRRYDDALVITEVEPLLAYLRSLGGGDALDAAQLACLRATVTEQIATTGAVRVHKAVGLFHGRR